MSWVANVMLSVGMADNDTAEVLSEWLRTDAPLRDRDGGGCGFLAMTTGQDTHWGGWLDKVRELPWRAPNQVQLFVMDQEEEYFRVWMIRGGVLSQFAPAQPDEEDPSFYP